MAGVIVEDGAIIGGRSVFKPGIRVGTNSVVAMASVVTKDVLPDTMVMGNPARPTYSRAEYDKEERLGVKEVMKRTKKNSFKPAKNDPKMAVRSLLLGLLETWD